MPHSLHRVSHAVFGVFVAPDFLGSKEGEVTGRTTKEFGFEA